MSVSITYRTILSLLLLCTEAISGECKLITTSAILSIDNAPHEVTALEIHCDGDYQIALDAGRWFSGSRQLKNHLEETIQYHLWSDPQGTSEWGDINFGGTYAAPPVSNTPGERTALIKFSEASLLTTDHCPPENTPTQ